MLRDHQCDPTERSLRPHLRSCGARPTTTSRKAIPAGTEADHPAWYYSLFAVRVGVTEAASSNSRTYSEVLLALCGPGHGVDVLREASRLSALLISDGRSPREIIELHAAAVAQALNPDDEHALVIAQTLLLEVLVSYGVAYAALAERRLAEADMAARLEQSHTDDAERAERDRLELLAGVSHELGTPLTVIKGNVASIRRFLEDRERWPEELSQREDDVEFAVERIVALRDELLAASRNEARELEAVPVHLHRALQRVVRWARAAAQDKELAVEEAYDASSPYAMGDEWAVQSIFGNLISNAIRYTPAGGSVGIRTYDDGADIAVEVADTGIGVAEADQPRLFERFYRTQEAKKTVPFGIGLGLAITRDLVSASGGTIAFTSQPANGTTFTVTFPRLVQEP